MDHILMEIALKKRYCKKGKGIEMRFLLFYGSIESLNHFTDEMCAQLEDMGHFTSIIDLCSDYKSAIETIIGQINAVICYDCLGMSNKELFDKWQLPVINILMDHPMSMVPYLEELPSKYIQLSPDEDHVRYAKKYIGVKNVFFVPHMASVCADFHYLPEEKKDITLLFPAGLPPSNVLYEQIKKKWTTYSSRLLVLSAMEYLIAEPQNTLEGAMNKCLADRHMELPDTAFCSLMVQCKDVDVFVRTYFREKVVAEIIGAGIPTTIIGSGWDRLECITRNNITLLSEKKFAEIFPYMERAQITLTVMPWFKAGTHDRIFNALMHYSCPLTDESSWLLEHLKPGEECAYYSLSSITEVPDKIYDLLRQPELREKIIRNGREKVLNHFTSKQIAEQMLNYLRECYG